MRSATSTSVRASPGSPGGSKPEPALVLFDKDRLRHSAGVAGPSRVTARRELRARDTRISEPAVPASRRRGDAFAARMPSAPEEAREEPLRRAEARGG